MNEAQQQEANVIRTLVMETFNYTSQQAISYIKEHNGIKHPMKILNRCKKALGIKEDITEEK